MDQIKELLTSTKGRVGRQQWWIGVIAVSVPAFFASTIVMLVGQKVPMLVTAGVILLTLVCAWPLFCLSLKRRHDRGNNGIDLKLYLVVALVFQILQAFRISSIMSGDPGPMPHVWMRVFGFAGSIFGIYLLAQLGFVKGTAGANDYGPDPLDDAG